MTNQPPSNQQPGGYYPPQPNQQQYYTNSAPPQQPYGYPPQYNQPGVSFTPPPPPVPPRKSKAGLIIGIVLGIFGLFIVAVIVGFVFLFSSASNAKTEGEKVVTEFMTALGSGNTSAAHSLLSPDFRQEFSPQQLQAQLKSNSFIQEYKNITFNNEVSYRSNNGVEVVEVSGKANFGAEGTSNTEFILRKVSGEGWRITKFSIRPPA